MKISNLSGRKIIYDLPDALACERGSLAQPRLGVSAHVDTHLPPASIGRTTGALALAAALGFGLLFARPAHLLAFADVIFCPLHSRYLSHVSLS